MITAIIINSPNLTAEEKIKAQNVELKVSVLRLQERLLAM
jgi:hypothetical protein